MKKLIMLSLVAMMGLTFASCAKEEIKEDVYEEDETIAIEASDDDIEIEGEELDRRIQN